MTFRSISVAAAKTSDLKAARAAYVAAVVKELDSPERVAEILKLADIVGARVKRGDLERG